MSSEIPTLMTAEDHEAAYAFFNRTLFGGQLTHCLVTLSRNRRFKGFYLQESFRNPHTQAVVDEIGMNPDYADSLVEYLSTLVHEMVHHRQRQFGKPGKNGYHNKAWAAMMLEVGLQPVSLDRKGKMTGRRVTHEIVAGAPFDVACQRLLRDGFRLHWTDNPVRSQGADEDEDDRRERNEFEKKEQERKEKAKRNKTPFVCDGCQAKIWGKPSLKVMCVDCKVQFRAVLAAQATSESD